MRDDVKRVLLGRVSGAHGIRGDVILKSFTEDPMGIGGYGILTNADGSQNFEITVKHITSKGLVARVRGITDRNGAEALKGTELYVTREQLGEPSDGEFFHVDLIGLSAVGDDGRDLGTVVDVVNYGAGDLLEIRLPGKTQTELVAFTKAFVPSVDFDKGQVVIADALEDESDDGD